MEIAKKISDFERNNSEFAAHTLERADHFASDIYGYTITSPPQDEGPRPIFGGAFVRIDDITFVAHRSNREFVSTRETDEDQFSLGFQLVGQARVEDTYFGEIPACSPHHARIIRNTIGTRFSVPAQDVEAFVVLIPARFLEDHARTHYGDTPDAPLRFDPLFDLTTPQGHMVKSLIHHLMTLLSSSDGVINDLWTTLIKELIASTLIANISSNYSRTTGKASDNAIPGTMRRAEDYMHAHADEPLTIGDLAREAGCSGRALQNAFKSFRNTTPMAMLRDIRLDRARRDLMHCVGSVTDIACRRGFSNTGRFSALYKQRFGELPSQTRPPPLCGFDRKHG